jgi:AcrR family transcriptional regulator
MPYRRTDAVVRRQAARSARIVAAARAAATEGGMAAVQVAPIAGRAGIATGTVYRYFPSKTELVAALVANVAREEIAALRGAARAAPGPVSALAAAIATFAARALRHRRLAWAVIAEPAEAGIEGARLAYRRALADELQLRIAAAMKAGHLPQQDVALSSSALVGALLEGLLGPLAPEADDNPARAREAVQTLTLLALRALGVNDARARGLVVQVALPAVGETG